MKRKRFHFIHRYLTVKDTGKHKYQECKVCGKRRLVDRWPGCGYQPIDREWLTVGTK